MSKNLEFAKKSAYDPSVVDPNSTGPLLLFEVLLEEYSTHRCAEAAPGEPGLKQAWQPWLGQEALDELRDLGHQVRRQLAGIKNNSKRALWRDRFDGDLVKLFYSHLTRAQKQAAGHELEGLASDYQNDHLVRQPSGTGLADVREDAAARAVIADVYGLIDDFHENLRREHANDPRRTEDDAKLRGLALEQSLSKVTTERDRGQDVGGYTPRDETGSLSAASREDQPVTAPSESTPGILAQACQARGRTLRSALCLSGGGIRSATFNLGILQGLARHGLLEQFDYLSTVSGGGFIGGWLTAWLHRAGTKKVMAQLSTAPPSPLDPEPRPLNHLRVFSNYLSPRPGLLSADTWTLIATVWRNLMLTWLVFVPLLIVILMAPRLTAVILEVVGDAAGPGGPSSFLASGTLGQVFGLLPGWSACLAVGLGWLALIRAGVFLITANPTTRPHDSAQYKNQECGFLVWCLLPAVLAAIMLALGWFRTGSELRARSWGSHVLFSLAIIAVPWIFSAIYRLTRRSSVLTEEPGQVYLTQREHRRKALRKVVCATVLLGLAQVGTGTVLYFVTTKVFPFLVGEDVRLYAALAVPVLLVVFTINCALIAGLTSSLTDDNDLEWWSRASAWLLITAVAWSAMHLLVLFAPSIILLIGRTWQGFDRAGGSDWTDVFKLVGQVGTVVIGVISGFITLAGGFTAQGSAEEKGRNSGSGLIGLLPSLLAPIFLAFLVILLAILTNWCLVRLSNLPYALPWWHFDNVVSPWDHAATVAGTKTLLLFVTAALFFVVGSVMGWFINSNKFSLHYLWRNRIVRAYLGASRELRNPQTFTGFDENDNLVMYELRRQPDSVRPAVLEKTQALAEERSSITGAPPPALRTETDEPDGPARSIADCFSDEGSKDGPFPNKLFHVLNIALNLAGGDKLAWQDRKSESFTVSPLHAGSYWLGYRRSFEYGGKRGISLGTSIAISGAFVSPNMGYMMSSPVVRFLMTLFNVRFGWWLGNPGPAGGRADWAERLMGRVMRLLGKKPEAPFQRNSPLLSARPIFKEAFGLTDDKNPYVYLSDGGHFENLGLYEMVLRRCRFIVVADATSDAEYDFSSLAQSIRQIRVDLGVPIDVKQMEIVPPSKDLRGKYCAVGKIRYSCVDRVNPDSPASGDPLKAKIREAQQGLTADDFDGTLIYIKASMIGEEPRDVVNYGLGNRTFPQEIIVDQWFSEAQFESYRALGSHIIDAICEGDQNRISLTAFERKAKDHNRVNFRVFKDRISFAALAQQFRKTMTESTPPEYADKVKKFMSDIME